MGELSTRLSTQAPPCGILAQWARASRRVVAAHGLALVAAGAPGVARLSAEGQPSGALVQQAAEWPVTDGLELPNGCVIEAVHFQQVYLRDNPTEKAGLLISRVWREAGDHAFVAYTRAGKIWTYCTLLGHQSTGLAATAIERPKNVLKAYDRVVRRKARTMSAQQLPFPAEQSGAGSSVLCVMRAAEMLEEARVKSAVIGLVDDQGNTQHVLVFAWKNGAAVYTPATGTILTASAVFGAAEATAFAQTHLKITPRAIRNESLAGLRAAARGLTLASR